MTTESHKPEVKPKDKKIHPRGKSGDMGATRPRIKTIAPLHAACGFEYALFTRQVSVTVKPLPCSFNWHAPKIPNQQSAGVTQQLQISRLTVGAAEAPTPYRKQIP